MSLSGAFKAQTKDGAVYYRSSITYKNKHISLGSYSTEAAAHKAYTYADKLVHGTTSIDKYKKSCPLSFEKFVVLINFRDNNVYIKNPIYLENRYFNYYLDTEHVYKFDIEDLFYYSEHKISRRGGHLFVADYGMQVNINTRYGIKRYAVIDRDYRFINGDCFDYRYENIEIINRYYGVRRILDNNEFKYKAVILINGQYVIGVYDTEEMAAIAYNKAVDTVKKAHPEKSYEQNYVDSLTPSEYANLYTAIEISEKLLSL